MIQNPYNIYKDMKGEKELETFDISLSHRKKKSLFMPVVLSKQLKNEKFESVQEVQLANKIRKEIVLRLKTAYKAVSGFTAHAHCT